MLNSHTYDHDPLPEIAPREPRQNQLSKDLPPRAAFSWLRAGWNDLLAAPVSSLLYGFVVFAVSAAIITLLFWFELDYALFPALSGFLVIGPFLTLGLYEKSRRLEAKTPIRFVDMILIRPRSGTSALMLGVMLLGLFLLWMRAAVLIWALFFGIQPFPGTDEIIQTLFMTGTGWGVLLVGGAVGALFASFAFAISVFSLPRLLQERTDAFTALGQSMATVWHNLPVMLTWGAIVFCLIALSILTALVGLILVVPVLGHATWHAYRTVWPGAP